MLAMRLARVGAKKKPAYRVVVIEKSRARDSRSVEIVGHYNPTKDPIELTLHDERIQHWLGVGARPSQTVRRLIEYKANPPAPKAPKPAAEKQQTAKTEKQAEKAEAAAPSAEPSAESVSEAQAEPEAAASAEAKPAAEETEPSTEESQHAEKESKPAE